MVDEDGDRTTAYRVPETTLRGATFVLKVTAGPDVGVERRIHASDALRCLVGKGPACDLIVTDAGVSRRHAAFEVKRGRLRITDLGSTNGTTVNGITIFDAELKGGERVRMGETAIDVSVESPPGAPRVPLPHATGSFGLMYGESEPMQRIYPLCLRLAAAEVAVVIEGETGTGKEVLAESIHMASTRAARPFVVFDCTTVPGNLMESELFGHEKGAFTGASGMRKGVFEQAHGGTLLIDEIGDLELALQPKLLRAVERGQVRRLGGSSPTKVDVRLIAATRRDLDREVAAGRFRDDLFHRLAVARIELPPLRDRIGDVRLLARRFCQDLGVDPETLPAELLGRWEDAQWPGNLRELRNAVARWVALGEMESRPQRDPEQRASTTGDPMDEIGEVLALKLPFGEARQRVIERFERRYVERVLAEHDGNVSRAAAASGIGRRYFHMLLARR